jgi:hypothetical protein
VTGVSNASISSAINCRRPDNGAAPPWLFRQDPSSEC